MVKTIQRISDQFQFVCTWFMGGCSMWLWLFASVIPKQNQMLWSELRDWFRLLRYNRCAHSHTVYIVVNYCYYYNGWWLSICCQWVKHGCSPRKPKTVYYHHSKRECTHFMDCFSTHKWMSVWVCACQMFRKRKNQPTIVAFFPLRNHNNKCEHEQMTNVWYTHTNTNIIG